MLAIAGCGRIGYTAVELGQGNGDADPGGADMRLDPDAPDAGGRVEVGTDGLPTTSDGGVDSGTAPVGTDGAVADLPTPGDPTGRDGSAPAGDMARDTPSVDLPIDRLPDSGCTTNCQPGSIELQGQSATTFRGTGPGMVLRCPSHQAIIGYDGTQSRSPTYPWLQSVTARCGSISISGSAATVTEAGTLPAQGATTAQAWSRLCPANHIVMGFEGWSGDWVGQLSFRCAPLVVSGSSVSVGPATTLPFVGSRSGSMFGTTDCPAGQIAAGQNVMADTWLKGFGLICATPVAVVR